ncbi:HYR domain-containing protein [Sediminibacterium sp. KACHI17]
MKKILHITACLILFMMQAQQTLAQAGTLDNSFNGNGIKVIPSSSYGNATDVAVQADGKSVLVGRLDDNYNSQYPFTIVRLNQDGTEDQSFGTNGRATVNIYANNYNYYYYNYSEAKSVAIQSDGKIVVAGNAYYQDYYYNYGYYVFTVVRLNSNGTIDNTFGGGDGIVQFNPSNNNYGSDVADVAIQNDGRILVAGSAYDYTYNYYGYSSWSYAMVRFNPDGSHDNTYNNGTGVFRHSFDQNNYYDPYYGYYYSPYAYCYDIAIGNDGKVVMNGVTRTSNNQYYYYYYYYRYSYGVVRVNTDGTLDQSFNGTGSIKLDVFPNDYNYYYSYAEGRGIAVQADNKIVVSGYGYDYNNGGNTRDYYVAGVFRLNVNGSLDNTFDGDGQKNFSLRRGELTNNYDYNSYTYSYPYAVLIQNDQKILVGGSSDGQLYDPQFGYTYRQGFSLARLNVDGSLDNTFGPNQNGVNTYNLHPNNNYNNSYSWSESMAKAPDGRIVMAGRSNDYSTGEKMGAIRVLVNNDCPASVSVNAPANACSTVVNNIASHFELKEGEVLGLVTYVITGVTTGSGEGDASGTTFNLGTSYITYTANIMGADEQYYQRQCTFSVTVKDVTPPVMTCLPEIRVSVQPGYNYVMLSSLTAPVATDLCGTVTVNSNNYPYLYAGDNYVNWIATDAAGNTTTCTQKVVVVLDNEPPVITCPVPIVVNAGEGCATNVTYQATATDNSGSVNLSYSIASGSSFSKGVTTVTVTATDAVGNQSTCSFTVTVNDNTAPVFTSTPSAVTVSNNTGLCGATVALTAPSASDNCGVASVTSNAPATFPIGTTVVTWTATDVNGNTSTISQSVTVNDTEAPVAKCQPVTVNLQNGTASITAADINNGSTDNCGIASMTISKSSFSCAEIGTHNVILTVTDVNGNQSTCTTQVTVTGSIPTATITAVPSSNVYTGGVPTTIYLGYGAQSVTLAVSASNGAPYTYQWTGNGTLSNTNTANPVFAPTAAGNYTFTVLVTNANGCVTTATIRICVKDIRVPGTAGKKVYVCHVPPGNSGNPQTLEISVNAVSAHIGAHSLDKLGSCSDQGCAVVTNAPQSTTPKAQALTETIQKAGEETELKVVVMPNPSSDAFTLRLESKMQAPVQMRITDASGRAVESRANLAPNSTLRVGSNFLSGTYYAEFIQANQRKVVQLIKVKR